MHTIDSYNRSWRHATGPVNLYSRIPTRKGVFFFYQTILHINRTRVKNCVQKGLYLHLYLVLYATEKNHWALYIYWLIPVKWCFFYQNRLKQWLTIGYKKLIFAFIFSVICKIKTKLHNRDLLEHCILISFILVCFYQTILFKVCLCQIWFYIVIQQSLASNWNKTVYWISLFEYLDNAYIL